MPLFFEFRETLSQRANDILVDILAVSSNRPVVAQKKPAQSLRRAKRDASLDQLFTARNGVGNSADNDLLASRERGENLVSRSNDKVLIGLIVRSRNIDQEQCDASIAFAIISIIARLRNAGTHNPETHKPPPHNH